MAHEHSLPAYVVFHDATLLQMAREAPATLGALAGSAASARRSSKRTGGRSARARRDESPSRIPYAGDTSLPDPTKFNSAASLPLGLRIEDFRLAMQDVYDFFEDVNAGLLVKGPCALRRHASPPDMSGLLSDMLTASLAKHSRALVVNGWLNGHPDLLVKGRIRITRSRPAITASRSSRRAIRRRGRHAWRT